MIGWIGSATLAAHRSPLPWPYLTFRVPLASPAATVRIGHARGGKMGTA
jgi:hypothetical protein